MMLNNLTTGSLTAIAFSSAVIMAGLAEPPAPEASHQTHSERIAIGHGSGGGSPEDAHFTAGYEAGAQDAHAEHQEGPARDEQVQQYEADLAAVLEELELAKRQGKERRAAELEAKAASIGQALLHLHTNEMDLHRDKLTQHLHELEMHMQNLRENGHLDKLHQVEMEADRVREEMQMIEMQMQFEHQQRAVEEELRRSVEQAERARHEGDVGLVMELEPHIRQLEEHLAVLHEHHDPHANAQGEQQDELEIELRGMEMQTHHLQQAAENLAAIGRMDQAEDLMRQAEEMQMRAEQLQHEYERQRHAGTHPEGEMGDVFGQIEHLNMRVDELTDAVHEMRGEVREIHELVAQLHRMLRGQQAQHPVQLRDEFM
ncbi:MAG: hypothetical protein D8M59_08225, partial [Planctomycetes bacterium]|nr:hypothetical protein [Planctomycetota bacterium]